jgi:hypothetical protein
MTPEGIKAMQSKLGVDPDGFWGPVSAASCQRYLKSLMPSPNPWPATDQASLTDFYGAAGDESSLVTFPAPSGIKYEGKQCSVIRCHAKVAKSLERIVAELAKEWPTIAGQYAGCFNNRNMRGGSLPSLHARGAAVDFAPDTNGNRQHWPTASTMPLGVMEIFAREGWLAAGAFWGRDAMHFETTCREPL